MHLFRHLTILFLLLVALSAAAVPLPGRSKPSPLVVQMQISGPEVNVTGLTPSRPVAVVAAWWIQSYDSTRVAHTWRDGMSDEKGAVRLTFREPIPSGALLVAIDIATGHIDILDVDRQRFRRIELPSKRFKRGAEGEIEEMAFPHDNAAIVLVREGVGAWIQIGGDGGNSDHDARSDGFLGTHPASMIPIAGSPEAPAKIKKRDVVLLLDAPAGIFGSTEVSE